MVRFFRGNKSNYSVVTHNDAIYFAQDTGEIIMNGKVYGASEATIAQIDNLQTLLTGSVDVDGSVSNKILKEINNLIDGANEDFDTLKEIADWITNHGTEALNIANSVSTLRGKSTTRFNGFVSDVTVANTAPVGEMAAVFFDTVKKKFVGQNTIAISGQGSSIGDGTYYLMWSGDSYNDFYTNGADVRTDKIYIDTDGQAYAWSFVKNTLVSVKDLGSVESRIAALENTLRWYEAGISSGTIIDVKGRMDDITTDTLTEADLSSISAGDYVIVGRDSDSATATWKVYKRISSASDSSAFVEAFDYSSFNGNRYIASYPASIIAPVSVI